MLTELGILQHQYGRGRGTHLRVNPDEAERVALTLIRIADEAREEQSK